MCSYGSNMAPLAQETCLPTLLPHASPITPPPPPRAFPTDPLGLHCQSKIAHFKAFLELAWAHVSLFSHVADVPSPHQLGPNIQS